jgi:ribosomal protein L4
MNPGEFRIEREKRLKEFEDKYATLKTEYSSALRSAMNETDRAKQCVLIKTALDKNREITTAVESFLTLSDDKSCKLTPEMVRSLRADIEKYKQQHAEIQQGRDRVYALQQSSQQLEQQTTVLQGSQFIYLVLVGISMLILFILVSASSIRDVLNTQPVAAVVPRGFT